MTLGRSPQSTPPGIEARKRSTLPDGPMLPPETGRTSSVQGGLSRGGTMPPAARVCAFLASFSLGAVLPILMVVANKSAPASLGAAAFFANLAVLLAGRSQDLKLRYRALLTSPPALVAAAVLALLVASFSWTIDPAMTARGLIEGLPELVFALATAAALPLVARRDDFSWLLVGLLGAAMLIVFENRAGMPLHALVRARGEAWDLKRSAIPPALLLWPAVAYWVARGQRLVAAGLYASAIVGVVFSHSGAPGFALGSAAGAYVLARFAPRLAIGLFCLIFALLLAVAPWTGTVASRFLPASVENALSEEHAAHRVRIWNAFESRLYDHPILGHGFDASFKVSAAPRPGGIPPEADNGVMLDNHPHDIFLQFWVELGLLGGMATAGVAAFVLQRLSGLNREAMAARLALLASVVAIGLVGLSAWQPWWLASIAAAMIWFDLLDREPRQAGLNSQLSP